MSKTAVIGITLAVSTFVAVVLWRMQPQTAIAQPAPTATILPQSAAAATGSPATDHATAAAVVATDSVATPPRDSKPEDLQNGPPPLRVFRCAAYTRMLLALRSGAERVALQQQSDNFDTIVRALRNSAGDGDHQSLGPDEVIAMEESKAKIAGERREQWLTDMLARCDQEIQWVATATGAANVSSSIN